MSEARNRAPANIWQALQRLLNCNKTQLAERLGVSSRTLRRWAIASETGEAMSPDAAARASDLLIATLRAAKDADALAQWAQRRD